MKETGPETVNSLADKLDAVELTEDERFVLDRLIERAGLYQPEVSGFTDRYTGLDSGADLTSKMGFRLGSGAGFFPGANMITEFTSGITEFRDPRS